MRHIVGFSGGKDSTAMLLRMIELKMPIDEIRYFDCGSWEFPQTQKHISKVEKYINRPIKRLYSKHTFDYFFSEKKTKGGYKGYGFPVVGWRWCTGRKIAALKKGLKKDDIEYIGYTTDELQRTFKSKRTNHKAREEYPLIKWGWSEEDCLKYCYSKGFTWDGLYNYFPRISCWCCPLQRIGTLRILRKHFSELWQRLLKMQKSTWSTFRMNGKTVFDLDKRFEEEDRQGRFGSFE